MRKSLYLLMVMLAGFIGANAQDTVAEPSETLTKDQLEAYREQAIRSIHDLEKYIQVIADKKKNISQRSDAVELALDLFQSDTNTIQVSSLKSQKINTYTIRRYLNNLKLLPYKTIKIEWYKVYLCSEFTLGPNGDYYGTATFLQKFEGTSKNEMGSYTDVTRRRIQIILKRLPDTYNGANRVNMYVLKLGDIKVEETSNE